MIYDEFAQLTPMTLQGGSTIVSFHAEELAKRAFAEGATHTEHKALQCEILGAVATAFNMARLQDLAKGTEEDDADADEGVALDPQHRG